MQGERGHWTEHYIISQSSKIGPFINLAWVVLYKLADTIFLPYISNLQKW